MHVHIICIPEGATAIVVINQMVIQWNLYILKDSPNKGHHRNYLPTKDTLLGPKNELSYSVNTFFTSEEWITSLQWTN